jgi:predicted phage terminase large subunit-like protein
MRNTKILTLLRLEQQRRAKASEKYCWDSLARPEQRIPDTNWKNWLILAGRGFGKTRTGSETIRTLVTHNKINRIALVGGAIDEVLSVMIFGQSGIMNIYPKADRPTYNHKNKSLQWANGTTAQVFSAHAVEKLRGPQFDFAWIDELAKFRNAQDVWDQLQLCLRLGTHPRCVITTTPRPMDLIKNLMNEPSTHITRGTTFDNAANLAQSYIDQIKKQYAGTSIGAQELYAEILSQTQGALWNRDMIRYCDNYGDFTRIVIGIDPAATHTDKSDETGIVVAGLTEDGTVYVLNEVSGKYSPFEWGNIAVELYHKHQADRIVAEINKGGDMVERVIKSIDPKVSFKSVRATRGKTLRAEPIAALYEQKKVFHSRPLTLLEKQLCEYTAHNTSKSPDRLDALVWTITELVLESEQNPMLRIW